MDPARTWTADESLSIDHGRRLASACFTARQPIAFTFGARTVAVHGPRADAAAIAALIEQTRKQATEAA